MIAQTLRAAGVVILLLVALYTGFAVTPPGPALITQAIFGACTLGLGYLLRSAVQEHREKP